MVRIHSDGFARRDPNEPEVTFLEEALFNAEYHLQRAEKEAPGTRWILFSGGNDSTTMLHILTQTLKFQVEGVVHVNTGTGIPETTQFVYDICNQWNLPLHELHPPESFEEVFINQGIISGLPGPGIHIVAYNRLKQRAVSKFVGEVKLSYFDRVMLLTGIREDESVIRMGYQSTIIDRNGAQVWVNPIYRFTAPIMKEYRALYDIPKNPVSEHLHLSGECLCGSYASPGELDEIAFFYPSVAARIREWERQAEAKGLKYHHWGQKRSEKELEKELAGLGPGPMCQSCARFAELPPSSCDICGKEFPTQDRVDYHKSRVHVK